MNVCLIGRDPWFTGYCNALARGFRAIGHVVEMRIGFPPNAEIHDAIVVLGPHEFGPPPKGSAVTVAISTEHDSSRFFQPALGVTATQFLDIIKGWYDVVVDTLAGHGSRHNLTFLPVWSEFEAHESGLENVRSIDVFWYGTITERRAEIMNKLASEVQISMSDGHIWGSKKEECLRASKVLVLPHAWDGPTGEPFRYADAAATGALLVSESTEEALPYEVGSHFYAVPADKLGVALKDCLRIYEHTLPVRRAALANARRYDSCFAAGLLVDTITSWRNSTLKTSAAGATAS